MTVENNDAKIVRITNIADFDFTPELGAMYGGVPYFVASGQSLLAPYGVGYHLARALARQIFLQGAPGRTDKELAGKGKDKPLWDDDSLKRKIEEIMTEEYAEEKPPVLTQDQIMQEKVKELNKDMEKIEDNSDEELEVKDPKTYKDKGEVIEALKAKGIKFDARKSKTALEEMLK